MVDNSQRKAKGFAAQIGVLLKSIPAVTLGEGVPFPFAKILSVKTVNTYIAMNTTIDAREEQGMVSEATEKRKSKSTKKSSSADNTPVKVISEVAGSKKRVATEDIASAIPTKRRTVKTKHSSSQEKIIKIQLGESVSITEVRELDVHLTSLPRISIHDKGKAILEEDESIRRNPAHELVELICGDIEFLIRIRDQVMVDVVEFFHSFSLNTLSNFDALLALKAKEKLMLEWAETDSLAMAVKRKGKFLAPGQPWTATASQIIDLLYDANSVSLEDLLAQQRAHGLPMEQPCASSAFDSSVDSGAILAQFYSVAKSTCWVRLVILIDGIWTPLQGPNFWKSGWHLSLFFNQKKMPKPAIEDIFALHVSLVEPVQYWEAAPYLIKTWRWAQVCADIVRYYMFGCLKPVRVLPCTDITVYNLGVERIPVDFLSMFAQGMACHSFIDAVVQRDSGDIQEVDITVDEEVDLVSSDVSTVYRSPSPMFQEVDSVEHDLQFALGPAIFPSVAQEERLYFVQSPASSPATYQPQESSSSSTDVSMHFDSTDVPLNAQADTQASTPIDFTMFTDALEDLRSSISQRIHDSNCEILSKVNVVEIGVREALFKQHVLLRQSLQDACRVLERQGVSQEMQINDLRKGLLAPVANVFQDLMAIKKGQREQDAKITALDTQIAAIRNEQLDFQAKIAADILSLSTQIGDITDYIRSGDAKKGEIGSSSRRPPPVRVERRPLPTPTNQGESSSGHGRVLSVKEAAEMVREADRQADRRERERERERRLRRRGH
ncbi:hypothetical protein F511_05641 [Dorcoceras hygrometricum]|uniref:Uncharacterized protein n=1 Tax=Dorcoceras hygrometricum TaxID=472368 RepID=A0A2Z7BG98_9LAMI|nr:hypothetical protein F511_05641 [Dorcoceras hygrometricum]